MQDKAGKQSGDRLTFLLFGDELGSHQQQEGDDFEMHFIVSILNFQRQFTACSMSSENSNFEGGLLGQKSYEDRDYGSDELTSNEIVNALVANSDNLSSRHGERGELEPPDSQTISVPSLNDSQRKAADAFLLAKDKRIRIVQG
jgi:hypothetical protein